MSRSLTLAFSILVFFGEVLAYDFSPGAYFSDAVNPMRQATAGYIMRHSEDRDTSSPAPEAETQTPSPAPEAETPAPSPDPTNSWAVAFFGVASGFAIFYALGLTALALTRSAKEAAPLGRNPLYSAPLVEAAPAVADFGDCGGDACGGAE